MDRTAYRRAIELSECELSVRFFSWNESYFLPFFHLARPTSHLLDMETETFGKKIHESPVLSCDPHCAAAILRVIISFAATLYQFRCDSVRITCGCRSHPSGDSLLQPTRPRILWQADTASRLVCDGALLSYCRKGALFPSEQLSVDCSRSVSERVSTTTTTTWKSVVSYKTIVK